MRELNLLTKILYALNKLINQILIEIPALGFDANNRLRRLKTDLQTDCFMRQTE